MNCADVQRVLPEMDEGVRNAEFQAHIKSCPECSELISDLELIASEARLLAESEEPSPVLWSRIAAELRSEGLIREPVTQPLRQVLVSRQRSWSAWWLVPVAALVIIGTTFVVKPKPAGDIAQQQTQAPENFQAQAPGQSVETQLVASSAEQQAEDQQFLDEVSQQAPMMKAAYENDMRSVNSYIDDARAYAQQNPNDEDARRHLMKAYEQKQMLYQMALSNIQ
jgi:hypothetical protein